MAEIKIECKPNEDRLKALGVSDWPIWTKEESVHEYGGKTVTVELPR
jgi:hypothetical protein